MELSQNMESDATCRHCNTMVKNPVELACGHHSCAECITDRLLSSKTLICPHCSTEHAIELSAVNTPSRLSLELLGKVQMSCKLCSRLVFAEDADKHLKSKCSAHTISSLGLSDIMKLPITTPLNDSEKKIGDNMVRRMIAGKTTPVPISTGGPVS